MTPAAKRRRAARRSGRAEAWKREQTITAQLREAPGSQAVIRARRKANARPPQLTDDQRLERNRQKRERRLARGR